MKRRLIEYLAVRKLNPQGHGPILCFLGPPGVGKTSLGQSIADALGRKFVRMSLGGIRDEAEIRGHRRTYIGSMPGRIIQELRRAGTRNPVMMLDEIDKLGADFRGDPASALLEVLDPRQNYAFVDRYLDVPFDLSQIIFIATANYIEGVPEPMRDRMEIISLAGYTGREKLEIARRYLVRRQLEENGLKPEQCEWEEEALVRVIDDYTHEAGVRELERQIGAVFAASRRRSRAARPSTSTSHPIWSREMLGPARYIHDTKLTANKPGVVTGLAYTPVGGEVLHIEATRYPGKGNITLTGQIGNVMKESMQAALSLVRSRDGQVGVTAGRFSRHGHPCARAGRRGAEGRTVGGCRDVHRARLAFQQHAGAFRCGDDRRDHFARARSADRRPEGKEPGRDARRHFDCDHPETNEKDLVDIPEEAKEKIQFVPVETVDEVLQTALEQPPSPYES